MVGGLHDRVHGGHQRDRDQDGAEPVDAVLEAHAPVLGDEHPAEGHRGQADGEVDEEDPVPAQRLGERAAGQQAERAARDGGEHVGAHRPRAVVGRGNSVTMMARITEACMAAPMPWTKRAAMRKPWLGAAPQRTEATVKTHEPGKEHALAAEQVAEAAGEQQEAAEGDEEGVDDPGQVALAEVQVALDRRQRHVHDRGVEHDHELGQADNHEGHPPAVVGGDGCGCGCEVHTSKKLGGGWVGGKLEGTSRTMWRQPPVTIAEAPSVLSSDIFWTDP